MAHLFDVKENTITYHLKEIYNSRELDVESTARKIRVVRLEGTRKVNRQIDFYNLDMILSIGYRVNSVRGIMFRRWSSTVLKQYLLQGYSINRQLVVLQQQVDSRFEALEHRVDEQQQQYSTINKVQLPQKEHDRFLIIDDTVYILGDSLKNLGHSMTTVLKTSFTVEEILGS